MDHQKRWVTRESPRFASEMPHSDASIFRSRGIISVEMTREPSHLWFKSRTSYPIYAGRQRRELLHVVCVLSRSIFGDHINEQSSLRIANAAENCMAPLKFQIRSDRRVIFFLIHYFFIFRKLTYFFICRHAVCTAQQYRYINIFWLSFDLKYSPFSLLNITSYGSLISECKEWSVTSDPFLA